MDKNVFASDTDDDESYTDSESSSIGLNDVPHQPLAATKKWDAFQARAFY